MFIISSTKIAVEWGNYGGRGETTTLCFCTIICYFALIHQIQQWCSADKEVIICMDTNDWLMTQNLTLPKYLQKLLLLIYTTTATHLYANQPHINMAAKQST